MAVVPERGVTERGSGNPLYDSSGIDPHLARMARVGSADPGFGKAREQAITAAIPLVQLLARRFGGRGESYEDLFQVGMVGLIKAVDHFDPARGTRFLAYATPTVVGEIKRHFRDRGWAMRPPRNIQQLRPEVNETRAKLTQRLHRPPTVAEIATELDRDEEEVIEAIMAGDFYHTCSLDRPVQDERESATYADTLGEEDAELDFVECREALSRVIDRLPAREVRILLLRYYGEKTQREIAAELGISQMHVSRLISSSLSRLRAEVYAA